MKHFPGKVVILPIITQIGLEVIQKINKSKLYIQLYNVVQIMLTDQGPIGCRYRKPVSLADTVIVSGCSMLREGYSFN